ncbi:MAG: ATP-binding protein [Verrucomicrobiota bacterium]
MTGKGPSKPAESGATAGRQEKVLHDLREVKDAQGRLLKLLGRITAQHTIDDICRTTVEGVRELLGFERAGLFLWDDSIGSFRGTFGTDMQLKTTDEHHYRTIILPGSPEERIVQGAAFERGCKLGSPEAMPGEENVSADLIALRLDGKLYGILSVDNRLSRRTITDQQLEDLQLVSQVLGNALELTRGRVALAESEQRFRQVAETSGEWIWELDRDGKYTYSSPVIRTILGYQPEEVLHRKLMDWVAEDDRAMMESELESAFNEKAAMVRVIHRQVHREGFQVGLETSAIPIVDAAGEMRGFRGAHRDVTREKDLESQLRHSQKIEAIGRLAGGIAHDFNNLLTAILGCSSLLLEELREDDPIRSDIEKIRQAGDRAATLTRQLLAFSRRQVLHVQKLSVNDVVRDMEKMLRRTLGEDIELVTKLDPRPPFIESDMDQLQQIILHLLINARDAMSDPQFMARAEARDEMEKVRAAMAGKPKRLTIETASATLDEAFCAKHVDAKPGTHVVLTVSDTGIGMPAEVREHLFEPFFTTKEVGRGSGLGLSTIYGIVQQMGGFIEVESTLGEGTTFRIYLPLSAAHAAPKAEAKMDAKQLRGQETVLIVEDEDIVRTLTVRMLQTLGYHTLEAADGARALDLCRSYREPIQLVLTDMIMPHMSGAVFVEELHKIRDRFKVLYVSGYGSDETVGGRKIGADTPLIQKPFTREMLAQKIREVLDAR